MNLLNILPFPVIQYEILSRFDLSTLKIVRSVNKRFEQLVTSFIWTQDIPIGQLDEYITWRDKHNYRLCKKIRINVNSIYWEFRKIEIPNIKYSGIEQIEFTCIGMFDPSLEINDIEDVSDVTRSTYLLSRNSIYNLPSSLKVLQLDYGIEIPVKSKYINLLPLSLDTLIVHATHSDNEELVRIVYGETDHIKLFLSHHSRNYSPLIWSLLHNQNSLAKWICDKGYGDGNDTSYILSPIGVCCQLNNVEMLKFFISKGANLIDNFESLHQPLICAVMANSIECVKLLLDHGVSVNMRHNDETALVKSILSIDYRREHPFTMVNFLIEHGANVNSRDQFLNTPLHMLIGYNSTDLLELLIQKGANINATNMFNQSVFYRACEFNNVSIVKRLISLGNHFMSIFSNQKKVWM